MRIVLLLSLLSVSALAFTPVQVKIPRATSLNAVNRRDVLITVMSGIVAAPAVSQASGSTFFFDEKIETVHEPSQMHTGDRLDLNSAFVVRTGRCSCLVDALSKLSSSQTSFTQTFHFRSCLLTSLTTRLSLVCTRMRRVSLQATGLT
jgi:hypothetical protein